MEQQMQSNAAWLTPVIIYGFLAVAAFWTVVKFARDKYGRDEARRHLGISATTTGQRNQRRLERMWKP